MADKEFEFAVENREELKKVYDQLFPSIPLRTIFLLSGEVGVGKTESVRIFAELWGLEPVTSPSYSIINEYCLAAKAGIPQDARSLTLYHVDLYRLQDEGDLESTGFWDLFRNPLAVVVLEWADRLETRFLPLDWQQVQIQIETPLTDFKPDSLETKTNRVVRIKMTE